MVKNKRKRVMSYQKLSRITSLFGVRISSKELLGKDSSEGKEDREKTKPGKTSLGSLQTKITDFLGSFLPSDVLS